ncbi:hypothetical protein fugu_019755 [Takifugu bimaculatus]|uniref:TNase-like domain-containing protein n=1 Tax=Takifugu bimaculatus TaxID=433685 RepID=A0A4Z2BGJ4_9TELE|nr:hypothetical protein fugu_019755 [Takifugu bimaculatus]
MASVSASSQGAPAPTGPLQRGIVKMVLSGCAIIVRGQPRGGPPPERQINLSNIRAGAMARRAAQSQPDTKDTPDEPWAFQAREFLRKKLIGKEVCFTVETKTTSGREYGVVYLGKDTTGENIAESLVSEGLATVRREGIRGNIPEQVRLCEIEDQAKSSKKGCWTEAGGLQTIRDLKYTIESPRNFVDSLHQKPVNAIIEHVRDGSVVRALLLPDYYLVTVMLSGIKCPVFRREADGTETPEPFAAEAKFFTESRLLTAGRSDHPGELPQPDHTGNHPPPERQHHGAAAEGRLRPLCGLVHGGVHAGRRETARSRAIREKSAKSVSGRITWRPRPTWTKRTGNLLPR